MIHIIQAVKAALHFAAKKDIRYYMNGVALYVQNGNILSVAATDGHRMCTIGDHNFNQSDRDIVIVDRINIPTLLIALEHCTTVEINNFTLNVGQYSIPLIDGRFPDVRRVLPSEKRTIHIDDGICFLPEYLTAIDKARKELVSHLKSSDRKKVSVKCRFGECYESGLFTINYYGKDGEIDDCRITIMPQRL